MSDYNSDLEQKLIKDNMTLKDHINNLQKTIKKLKTEMAEDSKNTLTNQTLKSINNDRESSSEKLDKEHFEDEEEEEEDSHHLKFSFNNSQKKNNENIHLEEPKITKKANIYKESITKSRKDNTNLNKMEKLKRILYKSESEEDDDDNERESLNYSDKSINESPQKSSNFEERDTKPIFVQSIFV